jgi:hypothetical protein
MTDDQVNLIVQHLCQHLSLAMRLRNWIRSCLCENRITDRLAIGRCDSSPRSRRCER